MASYWIFSEVQHSTTPIRWCTTSTTLWVVRAPTLYRVLDCTPGKRTMPWQFLSQTYNRRSSTDGAMCKYCTRACCIDSSAAAVDGSICSRDQYYYIFTWQSGLYIYEQCMTSLTAISKYRLMHWRVNDSVGDFAGLCQRL